MGNDFLEHLAVLKNSLKDHFQERHQQEQKEEEGSCQRFDRTLLTLLEAEDIFVRERSVGDIPFPGEVNSLTGFPSLPSFLADMKAVAKKNETIGEIIKGREVAQSCPHCLYNVDLGGSVRFVPLVTVEELKMKEEKTWLVVSLVHRIERTDGVDVLVRCGKHEEVADGLEKTLAMCRYKWTWGKEEGQQGRLEVETVQ